MEPTEKIGERRKTFRHILAPAPPVPNAQKLRQSAQIGHRKIIAASNSFVGSISSFLAFTFIDYSKIDIGLEFSFIISHELEAWNSCQGSQEVLHWSSRFKDKHTFRSKVLGIAKNTSSRFTLTLI
jgi:hypothetical protein